MHQTQWSPERPLPTPVSLASQSHHEKPPEVTCTSRGNPGFPASTWERPRETFFNTSRGQSPLPPFVVTDLKTASEKPKTLGPIRVKNAVEVAPAVKELTPVLLPYANPVEP